ncbi:MAG: DUF3365 domain-containing protein [Ignavibacteriaceae bacterium]|nr:DUF3365 domain-containing protein [Ignavibacteriaceae bacterium]
MKTLLIILSSLLFVAFISCSDKDADKKPTDKQVAELRTAAGDFMGKLKSVLVSEMQNNGVVKAVSVCSDTALILTEQMGKSKNLSIKRVSKKNRNPKNVPDAFEQSVLEKFQSLKMIDKKTEYAEITRLNGNDVIRYMKPIIMQDECITCHGDNEYIPDAVSEILNERYPNDKARGYSSGELRGAVSIIKVINN